MMPGWPPGRREIALVLACAALASCGTGGPAVEPGPVRLTGDWLGQPAPGDRAARFAPGIVSTGMYTRDLSATPDGDEVYFTVMLPAFEFSTILFVRRDADGVWGEPQVAPFSGSYRDLEPFVTPDGSKLLFVSFRPDDQRGEPSSESDVWVVDRSGDGWGDPRPLGVPVNTDGEEYFPSTTRDGTLYFTRRRADGDEAIYRAEWRDERYAEPERLGPEVNAGRARFNAFVSPDERFLIVPIFGLDDSLGGTDYYVNFRTPDGHWTPPFHLGAAVNSESRLEYSASLSPDGRYLFFMSAR
ncbi:MAG TPA: hypothetical protein VD788_00390, partial [Candidatus Polarisedimenticolaceae bacterium]|nr:hypothetical protein [Candidatus Polarisedimenticolaceae bacterium]